MLVHLGRGVSVRSRDILLMTDLETPLSGATADLLSRLQAAGCVRTLGPHPKSLVLCQTAQKHGEACTLYLSCVGIRTLALRCRSLPSGSKEQI